MLQIVLMVRPARHERGQATCTPHDCVRRQQRLSI